MDLSKLIGERQLQKVAVTAGIPNATLHRWRKNNKIPGGEPVQAFHLKRIKDAVRKVRSQRADA